MVGTYFAKALRLLFLRQERLSLFFASGLLFHLRQAILPWFVAWIASWLLTRVLGGTGAVYCAYVNSDAVVKRRLKWLNESDVDECTSELKSQLPPNIVSTLTFPKTTQFDFVRRYPKFHQAFEPFRAFIVRPADRAVVGELKAYPSLVNTSLVFLIDRPLLSEPVSRFYLYHELGHISKYGMAISGKRILLAFVLIAQVLVFLMLSPFSVGFVALLAIYVLANGAAIALFKIEEELKADAYAINRLGTGEDIAAVLADQEAIFAHLRGRLGFQRSMIEKLRIQQLRKALHQRNSGKRVHLLETLEDMTPSLVAASFIIWAAYHAAAPTVYVLAIMIGMIGIWQCVLAPMWFGHAVRNEQHIDTFLTAKFHSRVLAEWLESAASKSSGTSPPDEVQVSIRAIQELYGGEHYEQRIAFSNAMRTIEGWIDQHQADSVPSDEVTRAIQVAGDALIAITNSKEKLQWSRVREGWRAVRDATTELSQALRKDRKQRDNANGKDQHGGE